MYDDNKEKALQEVRSYRSQQKRFSNTGSAAASQVSQLQENTAQSTSAGKW